MTGIGVRFVESARGRGRRIVFPEAADERVMRAVRRMKDEGICEPVLVGDREAALRAASGGVMDHGLMLDHVHPNIHGSYLVAREAVETTVRAGLLPFVPREGPLPDYQQVRDTLRISVVDDIVAFAMTERYFAQSLIGKSASAERSLTRLARMREGLLQQVDGTTQAALKRASGSDGELEVHDLLRQAYSEQGRSQEALLEARRAVWARPERGDLYVALAWQLGEAGMLGQCLESLYDAGFYGVPWNQLRFVGQAMGLDAADLPHGDMGDGSTSLR